MKSIWKIAAFVILMAISVQAQTGLERSSEVSSADLIGKSHIDNKFSLLDLSRLEMNHSYSISYFSSGGHGTTIGMYINSMRYRVSNAITVNLQLAWVHQPGNFLNRDGGTPTDYGDILPSFSLEYRPSENVYLEIGYHSVPAYMYYGYPRYRSLRSEDYWFDQ